MIAPFPWFGGKRTVADIVWSRFGEVRNYVEPFFGSGAVLLGRPGWTTDTPLPWIETINDKDGFVANFWRALQHDPAALHYWCDWPVNENDLHARHAWLNARRADITARLEGDPEYYDAKVAGWWLWGICLWIGSGWCAGVGPWHVVDGRLVNTANGNGQNRKLVHLGDAGMGINRQLVHLGNAGRGINRQLVHLGDAGRGDPGDGSQGLEAWIHALAARIENVRVCSGDWERVCGDTPTIKQGLTGVFLDPPYSAEADRDETIYATEDLSVARDVRRWCVERGGHPLMRIALCGYAGEHDDDLLSAGWTAHAWKAHGGYGVQGAETRGRDNAAREVIWFSPHCLTQERAPATLPLFAESDL